MLLKTYDLAKAIVDHHPMDNSLDNPMDNHKTTEEVQHD